MNRSKMFMAVGMLTVLSLIFAVSAYSSQIISYQGFLTDSDGSPVADGDYVITFTIYDGGGVGQWTSGPQDIPVTNGAFHHNLGSVVPIPDDVFEISALYLGIKIGVDPEIAPKTLLTSAPSAAVATNLSGGSLETDDGSFVLKDSNGDSAMIFIAGFDSHVIRVHPPDPCVPPEPCKAIELKANNSNRIDVYYPNEEADAGIVQLIADPTQGGLIEIHAAEPLLSGRVLIGGSATDTGFVRLLGGSHKAEYRLLEMTSHTNTGGAMTFYDPDPTSDGRALMTSKSSPTEGTSIVGFNPQPEPPGIPAFNLGVNPGGKAGPGSYFRLYNPLTESLDMPLISMTTSTGEGGRLSFFGSVPPDDSRELLRMESSPTEGIGIYGFNPQPEPPGIPAFELLIGGGGKGPGGRVAVYNPTGSNASMEGGIMQIGSDDVDYPSGLFQVTSTTSELTLTGESAAGDPPVISMVARADSAKVGIGTDTPAEALHVIGNIALTGEVIVVTDTKLKTNIRSIDNAVDIVKNMNGSRYNYRYNEYPEMKLSQKDQIGLLAQDVEKVLPELVFEDGNGTKYVAYTKLTAVLIEAIKEQQETINRLEKRIEALEN